MNLRGQRKFREFLLEHPDLNIDEEFHIADGCECEDCGTYNNVYSCEVDRDVWPFLCKSCLEKYPTKDIPEPQSDGKTLSLRFAVLNRDNFHCVYCGRGAEDGAKLQVDHVYPRSKGGKDTMENLVTACWECNMGKGDLIINYRRSQGK